MILYDNIVCLGSIVFNLFSSVCLQNLHNRNMGMNLYNNIIYLLPFSLRKKEYRIEKFSTKGNMLFIKSVVIFN